MSNKKKGPTEKTKGDAAYAVARGVLGFIPYAGSSAIELLNAVITPPLERRRQAWMTDIGERLEKLEADGFDIAALQKNEELANRLRLRHREVFQRLHEQYDGQILQYFGAVTSSFFPSTIPALDGAVACQHASKKEPRERTRSEKHTFDL